MKCMIYMGKEEESAWSDYLQDKNIENTAKTVAATAGFTDFVNWLKTVNLDGLQEGIGNVQRVLGIFQDFSKKDEDTTTKQEYKPRPIYKHFED